MLSLGSCLLEKANPSGISQHRALSGAWRCCRQRGLWLHVIKTSPGLAVPGPLLPGGTGWAQQWDRKSYATGSPWGHLSTAGLGPCLQPLLSGTATSSVCPHPWLTPSRKLDGCPPVLATQSQQTQACWGKRPREVESWAAQVTGGADGGPQLPGPVFLPGRREGGIACDTMNSL